MGLAIPLYYHIPPFMAIPICYMFGCDPTNNAALLYIREKIGLGAELEKFLNEITGSLAAKHDRERVINGCVNLLRKMLVPVGALV
jgi:hypothetical protein